MAVDNNSLADIGAVQAPFPVETKEATALVNGVQTDVSSFYFSDRIVIKISQDGRLSQWIAVPLSSASPTSFETSLPSLRDDMLPLSHLTPKTLLGAGGDDRETIGHSYAANIANQIITRNPEERRTVVVGLGLLDIDTQRETFFDMVELLQQVI